MAEGHPHCADAPPSRPVRGRSRERFPAWGTDRAPSHGLHDPSKRGASLSADEGFTADV